MVKIWNSNTHRSWVKRENISDVTFTKLSGCSQNLHYLLFDLLNSCDEVYVHACRVQTGCGVWSVSGTFVPSLNKRERNLVCKCSWHKQNVKYVLVGKWNNTLRLLSMSLDKWNRNLQCDKVSYRLGVNWRIIVINIVNITLHVSQRLGVYWNRWS